MKSSRHVAIACDLGTSSIAASLIDVDSGKRIAMLGAPNPQISFGADVLSRLDAAWRSRDDLLKMQQLVKGTIVSLFVELYTKAQGGLLRHIAIAGNPAMEHVLLGLPVEGLCFPPYRPLFFDGQCQPASSLGWEAHADIPVHIFPLPGGFVGGDLVAFLFGSAIFSKKRKEPVLFLDIGTNGEIALLHDDKIYATSAAAGPAFEGGNISCGMIASPGAITRVSSEGDKIYFTTFDGGNPKGLAGSAVIDTVAALLDAGVITPAGQLLSASDVATNLGGRVVDDAVSRRIFLYKDAYREVSLSQEDIRQVQLAKAAIVAGIDVLLDKARIQRDDLQDVIVTGSFGAELDPVSLKKIGVFTEKMVKKARFLREGALTGVERMLAAPDGISAVEELARSIDVIPLSGTPAFEKHFLQQLNFP